MGGIYWIARDSTKILFYKTADKQEEFIRECIKYNSKGIKLSIYKGYFNPKYAKDNEPELEISDNDSSSKHLLKNINKGDAFKVTGKISMYKEIHQGDVLTYTGKKKNGEIILQEVEERYTISIPTCDNMVPAIKDKQITYIS
jgi:hypothetical protein